MISNSPNTPFAYVIICKIFEILQAKGFTKINYTPTALFFLKSNFILTG